MTTDSRTCLTTDSRISLLAAVLARRMARWGALPPAAERRVILALASDTLPDPYPPTPEEARAARRLKLLLLPHTERIHPWTS